MGSKGRKNTGKLVEKGVQTVACDRYLTVACDRYLSVSCQTEGVVRTVPGRLQTLSLPPMCLYNHPDSELQIFIEESRTTQSQTSMEGEEETPTPLLPSPNHNWLSTSIADNCSRAVAVSPKVRFLRELRDSTTCTETYCAKCSTISQQSQTASTSTSLGIGGKTKCKCGAAKMKVCISPPLHTAIMKLVELYFKLKSVPKEPVQERHMISLIMDLQHLLMHLPVDIEPPSIPVSPSKLSPAKSSLLHSAMTASTPPPVVTSSDLTPVTPPSSALSTSSPPSTPGTASWVMGVKLQELVNALCELEEMGKEVFPMYFKAELAKLQKTVQDTLKFLTSGIQHETFTHNNSGCIVDSDLHPRPWRSHELHKNHFFRRFCLDVGIRNLVWQVRRLTEQNRKGKKLGNYYSDDSDLDSISEPPTPRHEKSQMGTGSRVDKARRTRKERTKVNSRKSKAPVAKGERIGKVTPRQAKKEILHLAIPAPAKSVAKSTSPSVSPMMASTLPNTASTPVATNTPHSSSLQQTSPYSKHISKGETFQVRVEELHSSLKVYSAPQSAVSAHQVTFASASNPVNTTVHLSSPPIASIPCNIDALGGNVSAQRKVAECIRQASQTVSTSIVHPASCAATTNNACSAPLTASHTTVTTADIKSSTAHTSVTMPHIEVSTVHNKFASATPCVLRSSLRSALESFARLLFAVQLTEGERVSLQRLIQRAYGLAASSSPLDLQMAQLFINQVGQQLHIAAMRTVPTWNPTCGRNNVLVQPIPQAILPIPSNTQSSLPQSIDIHPIANIPVFTVTPSMNTQTPSSTAQGTNSVDSTVTYSTISLPAFKDAQVSTVSHSRTQVSTAPLYTQATSGAQTVTVADTIALSKTISSVMHNVPQSKQDQAGLSDSSSCVSTPSTTSVTTMTTTTKKQRQRCLSEKSVPILEQTVITSDKCTTVAATNPKPTSDKQEPTTTIQKPATSDKQVPTTTIPKLATSNKQVPTTTIPKLATSNKQVPTTTIPKLATSDKQVPTTTIPKLATSNKQVPTTTIPKLATSSKHVPTTTIPKLATSNKQVPTTTIPKLATSNKQVPTTTIPKLATSDKQVPTTTIPKLATSDKQVPTTTIPKLATSDKQVPTTTIPKLATSNKQVPTTTIPKLATSSKQVPTTTIPKLATSDKQVPTTTIPKLATSDKQVPTTTIQKLATSNKQVPTTTIPKLATSDKQVPTTTIQKLATSDKQVPTTTIQKLATSNKQVPTTTIPKLATSNKQVPTTTIPKLATSSKHVPTTTIPKLATSNKQVPTTTIPKLATSNKQVPTTTIPKLATSDKQVPTTTIPKLATSDKQVPTTTIPKLATSDKQVPTTTIPKLATSDKQVPTTTIPKLATSDKQEPKDATKAIAQTDRQGPKFPISKSTLTYGNPHTTISSAPIALSSKLVRSTSSGSLIPTTVPKKSSQTVSNSQCVNVPSLKPVCSSAPISSCSSTSAESLTSTVMACGGYMATAGVDTFAPSVSSAGPPSCTVSLSDASIHSSSATAAGIAVVSTTQSISNKTIAAVTSTLNSAISKTTAHSVASRPTMTTLRNMMGKFTVPTFSTNQTAATPMRTSNAATTSILSSSNNRTTAFASTRMTNITTASSTMANKTTPTCTCASSSNISRTSSIGHTSIAKLLVNRPTGTTSHASIAERSRTATAHASTGKITNATTAQSSAAKRKAVNTVSKTKRKPTTTAHAAKARTTTATTMTTPHASSTKTNSATSFSAFVPTSSLGNTPSLKRSMVHSTPSPINATISSVTKSSSGGYTTGKISLAALFSGKTNSGDSGPKVVNTSSPTPGNTCTAPVATTVRRTSAVPASTTVGRISTAPVATTVRRTSAAPVATTVRRTSAAPVATTVGRISTAPVSTTVGRISTAPVSTTVRRTSAAPVATTVRRTSAAPVATTVRRTSTAPASINASHLCVNKRTSIPLIIARHYSTTTTSPSVTAGVAVTTVHHSSTHTSTTTTPRPSHTSTSLTSASSTAQPVSSTPTLSTNIPTTTVNSSIATVSSASTAILPLTTTPSTVTASTTTPICMSTAANGNLMCPPIGPIYSLTNVSSPETSNHNSNPALLRQLIYKSPPPVVRVQASKVHNGLLIKWTFAQEHLRWQNVVKRYDLYAFVCNKGTTIPDVTLWGKVGEIKPLALPMAVTLTNFAVGQRYAFAVRVRYTGNMTSCYSNPCTIDL